MIDGSSADHWLSMISAFGDSPCFFIASSEAMMTQDAPSVICEELPAVTLPHGRSNAGFNFASFSTEEFRPHAVVVIVELAVPRERRLDLALQKALLLRAGEPPGGSRPHRHRDCSRVMPNSWPTISAVWPMFRSTTGSVSPRSSPMIGLK